MRDGGTIVIGVEQKGGTFTPVGVSTANEKTYKIFRSGRYKSQQILFDTVQF